MTTEITEATTSRIEALVRLLADDDPGIVAVVWKHLEEIGEAALPRIRVAVDEAPDPRVRAQCCRFLAEWQRRQVFLRWVSFCKRSSLDLEEGSFLIVQSEYPDHDISAGQRVLDHYARVLRGRLTTARSTEEAVRRISTLLFQELGYRGNSRDYYNPDNSYLNRVLETRRGIPISLGAVYLLTARRVGVALNGIGMPIHFLLSYRGASHEVFVDVFHSGAFLTARDCARRLAEAEIAFSEEFLRPLSDRDILRRMLGNLLQIYNSQDDVRRRDRVAAMLKLLE